MERSFLTDELTGAVQRLIALDVEILSALWISLSVSLRAIILILPAAVLAAYWLYDSRFVGRRLLLTVLHASLALPTVVIGLVLYLLFSRQGPLGDLGLLFSQSAMMIGQMILAFPLVVTTMLGVLLNLDHRCVETARTLGAKPLRLLLTVLYEVRYGLVAAAVMAFGRVISEVGCSIMIGGNILYHTRNITSAIALETNKGNFELGIALGLILVLIALVLNAAVGWLSHLPHRMVGA